MNNLTTEQKIWRTILEIKEKLPLINKKYTTTHFEFINNSGNWKSLEDFLSEEIKEFVPLAEVYKNKDAWQSMLDELFHDDFEKIMRNSIKSFIKKNYIYNKNDISVSNIITSLNNMEYSDNSVIDYSYYIGNNKCHRNFYLTHYYDSSDFKVDVNFTYSHIGKKEKKYMNNSELNIYNHFINNFENISGIFEINKKNIKQFCDGFLKELNKLCITSEMVITHHNKNQNIGKNTHSFLDEDYTNEKIISLFKYEGNPDYKPEDVSCFYDPLTTLAHFLCQDTMHSFLSSGIVNIFPSQKFAQFSIKIKDFYENPPGEDFIHYDFKVNENKLEAYVDDIKIYEWADIKNTHDISDQIADFIKSHFAKTLNEDVIIQEKIKLMYTTNIKSAFDELPVDVIFPAFSEISIDDFSSCRMPLTLVCGTQEFNKNLSCQLLDLLTNEELKSFKERAQIMYSLNDIKCSQEYKNKKRI